MAEDAEHQPKRGRRLGAACSEVRQEAFLDATLEAAAGVVVRDAAAAIIDNTTAPSAKTL